MFDTLGHDLRYAFRNLRSSPGFAAVAILSLALGIGANTAIFSLIDAVMLKSLPVDHPEQLLQVGMGNDATNFTNPLWEELRARQKVFSNVFAFGLGRFNLNGGGEARYASGAWTSGGYFTTLGVRSILGRTFTGAEDRRGCASTAVLGYDFWQKDYGAQGDILGRMISLEGHPFEIIGVLQPGFSGLEVGMATDIFVPICTEPVIRGARSQLDQRSTWWLNVIGRPKPGLNPQQVTAGLKTIAPQVFGATIPEQWTGDNRRGYITRTFETVPAANGLSYLRVQYRQALFVLMGVVGVVLLIACVNVANLLLARAAVRQREMAIRMAIGAGRGRLIRQLLTESVMLSFAGAALGVLFAQWSGRALVGLLSSLNNQAYLDLTIDPRMLWFTVAVAVLTGLLFGAAPAWKGTHVAPLSAMKTNARGAVESGSRFGLGKALVILQVALSLVLVTGAGLMLGTFWKLSTVDAGFERDHVLLIKTDLRNANYPVAQLPALYEAIRERLGALPGALATSFSDITPVSGRGSNTMIQVEGFVPKSRRDSIAWTNRVSRGFFKTFGTPLLAGRDFNSGDRLGAPLVAVVNEALAKKFFGNTNPVGRSLRNPLFGVSPPIEIVGVVKDAKYRSLREVPSPTLYIPYEQEERFDPFSTTFELRTVGSAASEVSGVKAAIAQVNPGITLEFRTLAAQVSESMNRERLLAILSAFFGGLALLLATIGLYGVMSYSIARRRNEIGIRMALGAERTRVLRMVLREVIVLIAVGVAIGIGTALAVTRVAASLLFGVTPTDPVVLGLAVGFLSLVAVTAGFLPARRASRLDPMTALREE